jgi:hypothetical protein
MCCCRPAILFKTSGCCVICSNCVCFCFGLWFGYLRWCWVCWLAEWLCLLFWLWLCAGVCVCLFVLFIGLCVVLCVCAGRWCKRSGILVTTPFLTNLNQFLFVLCGGKRSGILVTTPFWLIWINFYAPKGVDIWVTTPKVSYREGVDIWVTTPFYVSARDKKE